LRVLDLDCFWAEEVDHHARRGERRLPAPPLAVERLEDGRTVRMSGGDGEKLPVGTIIRQPFGGRRKLLEVLRIVRLWCDGYSGDPAAVPLMGEKPLHECVSRPR